LRKEVEKNKKIISGGSPRKAGQIKARVGKNSSSTPPSRPARASRIFFKEISRKV